jgi:hypothetical protein
METTIGPANSWRLVHNGIDVMMLMESAGYTTTIHTVFEAATEAECLSEISRVGLIPIPVEEFTEQTNDSLAV